jgi:hypothetical protein
MSFGTNEYDMIVIEANLWNVAPTPKHGTAATSLGL